MFAIGQVRSYQVQKTLAVERRQDPTEAAARHGGLRFTSGVGYKTAVNGKKAANKKK